MLSTMNHSRIFTTSVFRSFNYGKIFSGASYSNAQSGTTIDEHDVERYSQLNEIWWDPSGPVKALHSMNEIRVPFIRDGMVKNALSVNPQTPLENLKLLDIGCGGGILTEELAKIGAEVTGIDANKEMIEVAKHHSQSNAKLINKPIYSYATIEDHVHDYKNYYDGVVASEILEHVNNPELFVKASIEVLKPGGTIFFTTPNRTVMSKIFIIWIAEYVLKAIPKGTHEHNKFVRPSELSVMLEKSIEDKLRYIAVKPTASVSVLRHKVWHLLDLPDYCEEVIVLKADENKEIPLCDLRKGNSPQHPYILEVWLPEARMKSTTSMRNNMLTMGATDENINSNLAEGTCEKQDASGNVAGNGNTTTTISNETVALNGLRFPDNRCLNLLQTDYKKSEMTCRISSTTLFKLNGRKNRDSFTNILLKIQSDLCTLSNKLSNLENRIPM